MCFLSHTSQPTPTIIPVAGPAQLEDYFISPKTVGTHIQRILSKLDVHSRTEAVALDREGLTRAGPPSRSHR